jgi:hypothetical protein
MEAFGGRKLMDVLGANVAIVTRKRKSMRARRCCSGRVMPSRSA